MKIRAGRAGVSGFVGRARRTAPKMFFKAAIARTVGFQRAGKRSHAALQFLVHISHLPVALELIRGEAEARQHGHEQQAIPKLQTTAYGFENHAGRSMQYPWPRRVTMNSWPSFLRMLET